MRLLVYIEATSYLMPLWHEIKARSTGATCVVFLEENLTQSWDLDLRNAPDVEVLQGNRGAKLRRLWQLIGRRDIQLVHLAGWGHPLLTVVLVLAWLRGIPVTMETDTPLPIGLPLWKRAAKRLLYPLLFKMPAMFLPGGTRQAAYLRHYGVADQYITVARMTVDVAAISRYVASVGHGQHAKIRRDLGLSNADTVFLYVGRMEPYKGVFELIEAFRRLPVLESDQAHLLLVGDGSMRQIIGEAVSNHKRIHYVGRLTGNALLDVYAAADVLVLPSRSESWGLVVNEAMAAGLPVIATDRVGCVDDLVVDGQTGRVVPAESADALAVAMQSLYWDRALCGKMARRSRALIAAWTLENEAEIVLNTWNRLVKP